MRLKPLQIELRLVLCLVGTIVLLLIMALFLRDSVMSLSRYHPELRKHGQIEEGILTASDLLEIMYDSVGGFVATGNIVFLEAYHQAKARLQKLMEVERHLVSEQRVELNRAAARQDVLRRIIDDRLQPSIELTREGRTEEAAATLAGSSVMLAEYSHLSRNVIDQLRQDLASLERQQREETEGRLLLMWIGVGVIIFFTLIIARVMATSIVRPIQQLNAAVRRLQSGDYTARADLRTGDELETLADAFNQMADSILQNRSELEFKNQRLSEQQGRLQDMNAELERRVTEKTEQLKKTLDQAQAEQAKLEAIIERMPDGLVLIDKQGRFVGANDAALRILGHRDLPSAQDWMERSPRSFAFRFLNHETVPLDEFPFFRAFRGESFSNYTVYLRRPDNQTRLVSFSGGPAIGQGLGGTSLSLCIFRDVTEELALRKELEEKNLKLGEASRLKDEFLATLSHELRTPLTPIISCAQLLRTEARLSADDIDIVAMIERNAKSLSRMIDEMLDLSAIMNSKLHLNLEMTEMNEWVRRTIAPLRPAWEAKGLTCQIKPSPEPIRLAVDPARLTQVLTNLVTNAIKYTDQGGAITISVTLATPQGEAHVSVQDSGIGLSKREIDEIFNIFHQTRTSLARRSGGLGIGLSVARSLAELHGGGIVATSEGPGLGSTFTLWLPLESSVLEEVSEGVREKREVEARPAPSMEPHGSLLVLNGSRTTLLRGRRILLVEDSVDTLNALRRILERRECQVLTARSGIEGLAQAERGRPEIIISDIGLPEMDGLELIRRIRAAPDLRDVIAISLSGAGREQDRQGALEAGFNAHLLKPIDITELDNALVEALARKSEFGHVASL
jgi:PAS domain S-box-containing protein